MKIVMFGLAGSGTSTVGKLLAKKLDYTFMSTGNIFREYAAQAGMSLYDFENKVAKHDPHFDKKLDQKSSEYGAHNDNFVFESRLAWHFISDSVKIYIDCDETERYRRIHQREGGELSEIIASNTRRESELIERYSQVYPDITFPPNPDDFDIYIDANNTLPEEIITKITDILSAGDFTS